jgi:two-component system, OmpR family, response regulator AdeR
VNNDQRYRPESTLQGTKVLIAEDEPELAEILEAFLKREGSECLIARDGIDALDAVRWWQPDIVVLDIGLPLRDGFSVLAELRADGAPVSVLIVSAMSEDIDKLTGFRLGCDDYLAKPFNPLELVARAKLLAWRPNRQAKHRTLNFGKVRIDLDALIAFTGGEMLSLTPVEFRLLRLLVERAGRLVSRSQIVDNVLSEDAYDKSVNPHICRLRQKLDLAAAGISLTSLRGEGYRLDLRS